MTTIQAGIEGINHPCYVADTILEGIGTRVAEAMSNEEAMASLVSSLEGDVQDSAIAFNQTPDRLVPDIQAYLIENGGCDFVKTGECPLVRFLVDKVTEDY